MKGRANINGKVAFKALKNHMAYLQTGGSGGTVLLLRRLLSFNTFQTTLSVIGTRE